MTDNTPVVVEHGSGAGVAWAVAAVIIVGLLIWFGPRLLRRNTDNNNPGANVNVTLPTPSPSPSPTPGY